MKTRVRAVIIEDGKVLLIKRTKPDVIYWVIPGGAVEENETDEQALIRECREELGVDIIVKDLFLKMDSKKPETSGQKEHFYLCEIKGGKLGTGHGPEFTNSSIYIGKHEIEWTEIKGLEKIDLKPKDIRDLIYNKFLTNK